MEDSALSPADLTTHKKLRADAFRTREHLLDVLGAMLEVRGLEISLPDLAKEAGVATATVYRHFDDVHELREEFYRRTVTHLVAEFEETLVTSRGRTAFDRVCAAWVKTSIGWARAATFIRSAEGYLERVRRGDDLLVRLHQLLTTVIGQLVDDGDLPRQDVEYATLTWVTLFDERVLVDLESGLGWGWKKISRHLSATTLAALGAR
ncbi:TetR/AcrR family transcriptional regulator [Gryllotalpicola sp.]|uniref:TetR/AcrR family transcriptional regulator n=1 Tax=Gryllotalpicola sp. TaxID=1932787 RepID=UPI002636F5A2|nr:TetR/AcrR family transcriptional regulator [Gryllotalpicola sp.]